MRFSWKNNNGLHRAEVENKVYQIAKSPAGSVWELFELIEPGTPGYPSAMTHCYLTNAKSLASAKKIVSDLYNGKIYLDEACVPRKILEENDT